MVVGPLSDVLDRKNLYVWTCLVGTIPCLLTYWCVAHRLLVSDSYALPPPLAPLPEDRPA